MVSELDYQSIVSEFDSYLVSHTSDFVTQLSLENYYLGTSRSVMVSELDYQSIVSEFDSYLVSHTSDFVTQLS